MKLYFMLYILCIFSYKSNAAIDYFNINKITGETVRVSISDLELLPEHSVITDTIYTGYRSFSGILFKDLFKKYSIQGNYIRVFAWDDYSYSIRINELIECQVILASKIDGQYMTIDNFGPFSIIYPKGKCPELNKLDVNAKTVIQVKILEARIHE